MKKVYIAGPISRPADGLADNVNRATEAFVALAKAGLAPWCPHWSVFSAGCQPLYRAPADPTPGRVLAIGTAGGHPDLTHADWLRIDLAWVATADAVLRLPGESAGADREVAFAREWCVPVFGSVEEVVRWAAGLGRATD